MAPSQLSAPDLPREIAAGRYRLLRLIGRGGMGEVYEAENTLTHKRVAIKCIIEQVVARRDAIDRLAQEARGSGLIRHPNVVDVYDLLIDDGSAYLVMEYLEGEPLAEALKRGELPAYRIVQITLAAMRGVAEAHRKGVIHRDIKPDNIFLAMLHDTALPVPKVLDFGICKLRAAQPTDPSLTASGHLMGTPLYMSIEQLEGRSDVDGRADVYAFGVTLYQALTGELPYRGSTLPELIVNISTVVPPAPASLRPGIPTSLSKLIMWALTKKREERLASLDEFIRELEPFASEHGYRREAGEDADDPLDFKVVTGALMAPTPAASVAPDLRVGLAKSASTRGSSRRWLAAVLAVVVLCSLFVLASRLRDPRAGEGEASGPALQSAAGSAPLTPAIVAPLVPAPSAPDAAEPEVAASNPPAAPEVSRAVSVEMAPAIRRTSKVRREPPAAARATPPATKLEARGPDGEAQVSPAVAPQVVEKPIPANPTARGRRMLPDQF